MAVSVDPILNLPNTNSTGNQWMEWHKALRARYGKKQANTLFLRAWEKRRAEGNFITGNKANTTDLRNYLEDQGISISGDGYLDYASDFADDLEDSFANLFGIGKTAGIIIALIVLVPIAILLFNVARNPKLLIEGAKAARGV